MTNIMMTIIIQLVLGRRNRPASYNIIPSEKYHEKNLFKGEETNSYIF